MFQHSKYTHTRAILTDPHRQAHYLILINIFQFQFSSNYSFIFIFIHSFTKKKNEKKQNHHKQLHKQMIDHKDINKKVDCNNKQIKNINEWVWVVKSIQLLYNCLFFFLSLSTYLSISFEINQNVFACSRCFLMFFCVWMNE